MTATANKRTEMTTMTTMTTTMTTIPECGGGLPRFITEEEYEETFSNTAAAGTPRPGMNAADMIDRQDAANQAILTFSQVAKHAAAASKRRRSPKSRTDYSLMNKHVVRAFNDLEAQMKQHSAIMSEADFKLLKQALANFRVKLIVHDNMSLDELKALQAKTTKDIIAAQAAIQAYIDNTSPDSEQKYLDAKDRAADLNTWHTDLAKEIQRIDPSQNKGFGLSRSANTSAAAPLGVASQHARIAPATGVHFRNILSPETIRRTFISLEALTKKIRDELVLFLINTHRHKDRHEVIKQIKASIMAAKAAKK